MAFAFKPQTVIDCIRTTSVVLVALAGMAAVPAHASDGVITITGEITTQTCKINGNTPPYNLLVTLPKISSSALKNVNDTAGSTVFHIELTECPESLKNKMLAAYFEPGPAVDLATGNLQTYTIDTLPTKAASTIPGDLDSSKLFDNVEIQLANTDGSAIKIGAADHRSKGFTAVEAGSGNSKTASATLTYLARYIKTGNGAIKAGKVHTYVQYSILYP
ncbi:fimbrial protein [Bordetella avium]|uniref:Fimbrial subunit n=2 Tax=Bordetella avium TaxID=521 RepID=Q2KYT9_BORA1|nr:fimbrial protein [Bordetella avium]RIQ14727.1 fimbrial protein [Bordetella avium]RIQ41074.1 fimbrial protein [Bordetella avium]RIQ46136.1 fimbrial protein [Bordetella avium]RIQ47064.1 fimbrial protein [Bordetella avium]RIQ49520.1 fimbrial protein [Bordetella avium]